MGCTRYTQLPQHKEAAPVWFHVPDEYVLLERDGTPPVHPFFDFVADENRETLELNFVTTTPVNSYFGYDLDLYSGKLFREHRYCEERDVWGKGGKSFRPPATFGFVPRLFDQTGQPQMIAVFGRERYFHPFRVDGELAQRVRVVGAGLHQYCDSYPCETRERWLSRLVLIAVNPKDPELHGIEHLGQLKQKVNWSEFVTFMENGFGRNLTATEPRPAYRFVGEIGSTRAFEYALTKGHHFAFEELTQMRRSCHALYDYIWESAETIRKQIRDKQSLENNALNRLKELERERAATPSYLFSNVRKDPLEEQRKKLALPKEAAGNHGVLMNYIFEKYGREFRACSRYVRDSNLRKDPRRHWYFAFLRSVMYLEDEGYFFSCNRQAWLENPYRLDGQRALDPARERANCLSSQLDRAFDTSMTIWTGLRNSYQPHYRYLEFDGYSGGSHQTLYSWIKSSGKRLSCDKNLEHEHTIFPDDIVWEPFSDPSLDNLRYIR